jgi:hypothetical protein
MRPLAVCKAVGAVQGCTYMCMLYNAIRYFVVLSGCFVMRSGCCRVLLGCLGCSLCFVVLWGGCTGAVAKTQHSRGLVSVCGSVF